MYSNYYQTYVERDVRQFANIRNLIAFETFVRLLAGRVGQLVNISDLSGSTGVSATTLGQWLGILEASFIVFRMPPYFENLVVSEAFKSFYNSGAEAELFFFRDSGGLEVDLLVGGFERLTPIEIKSSRTFSPDFCRNFSKLRALSGKIGPGIVVYAGDRNLDFQGSRILNFVDAGDAINGVR